ncbi:MAG TPA: hypothetical protein VGC44_08415, partial [Longimicrobiales bacterium]
MAIKFNSAFRVSSILRAMASRERGAVMDQWAAVFGVEDGDAALKSIAVARLVGLLREQIDLVESQCVAADYSESTYGPPIAGARVMATAESLSAEWSDFKTRLTPDIVHTFLILADTLPNKETQLSGEEIDSFSKLYRQTMLQIEDGYVPRSVKGFLRQQMKIIANGVREYHVQGIQAFQRASIESAIQASGRPSEVDNFPEAEPVVGVTRLLKKIK